MAKKNARENLTGPVPTLVPRFMLRIDEDIKEELIAISNHTGRSINSLVLEAVVEWINRQPNNY